MSTRRLDLYHRTSEEAARAILATRRFLTQENTREAYASTRVDGHATDYGPVVVHVRVDETDAQLDDEFPDGEQHYRIPLERAEILEAFTVAPDGTRMPLTGTAPATRTASFPDQVPAHPDTTAADARPAPVRSICRGPQLGR